MWRLACFACAARTSAYRLRAEWATVGIKRRSCRQSDADSIRILLATIDALSTENAKALGDSEDPGAVETAVAATVEAMGLFDEPEATVPPTSEIEATSTPTPTPTNTLWFRFGNPTDPPDDDPPGPPPPTSTSIVPSPTPPLGSTSTPAATDTPVPPSTNTTGPASDIATDIATESDKNTETVQ